jgi:hypothetical protein
MMGSSTHPTVVSPQGTPSSDSGSPYDIYYRAPYLAYPAEPPYESKKVRISLFRIKFILSEKVKCKCSKKKFSLSNVWSYENSRMETRTDWGSHVSHFYIHF